MIQELTSSDRVDYAAREAGARGLEAFQGGDAAVSLLALVLVIAILYFLWDDHTRYHHP